MAHSYSHLFQLPTTGLRFFTVHGLWGRPEMALFLFTRNILEGKPIQLFDHGSHTRDFTYVDDIVEGVIRASDDIAKPSADWRSDHPDPATSNAPFRLLNIGNSSPTSGTVLPHHSPRTSKPTKRCSASERSGNCCPCSR